MESSLEMGAGGMPSGRGRRAPPGGHCTAFIVVQSLSCAQLFITLWLQPGFLVLHHLLEFAQTHVHWVDDAIQPSHPLLLPPPLIVAVQLLSRVRLFATPWTAASQTSLSFIVSWNLLKLMPIESVKLSNHILQLKKNEKEKKRICLSCQKETLTTFVLHIDKQKL